MASQSVLELAVNTGKWDSGLKKAKSALDNFTTASGGLQQALGKDADKMQKFVQMMGSMDSKAKTAKGQMNDYRGAIEQLTMQYNRMTEAQQKTIGQDYLRTIDQLRQKYQAVNQEVQQMNRSLQQTPSTPKGGGFLSGMGDKMSGALQVFAGNLMTKAAGAISNLGSEMYGMVQQGIELARQGEGIRIAFERLGRGDILDGLREATHGTVTDIELMKAAVKFNDFKLPIEELGTMLAFAQQKAKDTGQSVDYMVDSIVTGLGRKSLMILDNLGLSASEIKERMAETGDMTRAVGSIIREQMAKAGDYVETAADRAAQADVQLKNAMEQLGRTFQPLSDVGVGAFNTIKISALNLLNSAIKPLINALTIAGALRQEVERRGGNERIAQDVKWIANSEDKNRSYNNLLQGYMQEEMKALNALKEARNGGRGSIGIYEKEYNAAKQLREEFQKTVKPILEPIKAVIDTSGAEQSIDSLKIKLAELEAQRKKAIAAGDTELSKNLAKQITQTKADIKGLGGSTTTHKATPKTEEQRNAARIAELVKQYQGLATAAKTADDAQKAGLTERMAMIQGEIKNLQDRNIELKKFADEALQVPKGSLKSLQAEMTSLQNAQQLATNQSAWQGYEDAIKKVTNQIKELKGELSNIEAGNMRSLGKIKGVSLIDMAAGRVKGKGMKDLGLGDVPTRDSIIAKGQKNISNFKGYKQPEDKTDIKISDALGQLTSSVSSMVNGIESLGIEIPEGLKSVLGGIQAVAAILSGISALVAVISTLQGVKSIPVVGWALAHGGVVKAASGYSVPGRRFSGDMIPARLNAGELVLNQAQAGVIASALQDRDFSGGMGGQPYVEGEKIFLGINNTSKRMGRGEIVTTSMLKRMGLMN